MKQFLVILLITILAVSCKNSEQEPKAQPTEPSYNNIIHEDYELQKSTKNSKAVLVLFGGFPENAKDIKREFKILESAKNNAISVLYLNYNRKIWLEQNELTEVSALLQNIFKTNKLPTDNVYIGGFSSGGNMALLISDFMTHQNTNIVPKGVFIVDSPIDLAELYTTAQKNIELNFSNAAVEESTWLLETLESKFGNPKDNISNYEASSVFTSKTNNVNNIKHLKNTKIRLYTEPDTLWWKENTMAEYKNLNAYHIKKLSESLHTFQFKDVEYIPTIDKGYRSNGDRHPHSWAIVDTKDLIRWILN